MRNRASCCTADSSLAGTLDLSYAKKISLTFSEKSSSSLAADLAVTGGGVVTVTRALACFDPPRPVADRTQVVEICGRMVVEPLAATVPTPEIEIWLALSVLHVSVVD